MFKTNLYLPQLWEIAEGTEQETRERTASPRRFPNTTLASLRLTESDSSLRPILEHKGCPRNNRSVQRITVAPKLSTSCDSQVRFGKEYKPAYPKLQGDANDSQFLFQPLERPNSQCQSPIGLIKPEPIVFSKWKKLHHSSYPIPGLSNRQSSSKNHAKVTQRSVNSDSQLIHTDAINEDDSFKSMKRKQNISANLDRKSVTALSGQSHPIMSEITARGINSFQKSDTVSTDDASSTSSSSDHTLVGNQSQTTEETLTEDRLREIHGDTPSPEVGCSAVAVNRSPSSEELFHIAPQNQGENPKCTGKEKSTGSTSRSPISVDESLSSYSLYGSTYEDPVAMGASNSPHTSACGSLDTHSQSVPSITSGSRALPLHQDQTPRDLDEIQTIPRKQMIHWAKIGSYVMECYEKGKICDVRFHVEKEILLAHRAPLCTVSPYFASMFYKNDYLNSKPMAEVQLNGISMRSLKVFMNFVYTGRLEIIPPILLDLVKISELFEVPEVKQRCVREIDFLTEEELVWLLVAAREDTNLDFTEPLLRCISDKFLTVCNSAGFLELDVDTLCLILSDDRILTRSELDVFSAAVKWINHSQVLRAQFLETVMSTIRFPLLTQRDLFQCLDTCSLLGSSRHCLDMIHKANWIRTATSLERDDPLHLTIPFPRCRSSHENTNNNVSNTPNDGGSPRLMNITEVSSGSEDECATVIESRNQREFKSPAQVLHAKELRAKKHENKPISNQSNQIENHTVVVLDRKLYVIGGMCEQQGQSVPRRDVWVYSPEQGWQSLAPMKVARTQHCLCAVDGFIYAVGGLGSKNKLLGSVERYDPLTDSWCFVRSITMPRAGACAVESDGEIMVAGGFGDSADGSFPIIDSVECFNPFTNRWLSRGRLRFGRCNATLTRVGGTLYLSGGLATDRNLRTVIVPDVDVYDARDDSWMLSSRLDMSHHSAASTASGPLLYLIGGLSAQGKLPVQCLDTRTNIWLPEFPLPSRARWIRSVTLRDAAYF